MAVRFVSIDMVRMQESLICRIGQVDSAIHLLAAITSWKENGRLRKASTEDPKKLKIEKQLKAKTRVQRERRKLKAEAELRQAKSAQTSFIDLLDKK